MSGHARGGPLAGIRVLAIAKVWAGPYTAKLLAQLGAEVLKVESTSSLDEMRAYGGLDIEHAPYFLSQNTEALSVRVNMKSAEGLARLKDMIAISDIVLDNLRPGAMAKLGLSFAEMQAIRPDIIHVSIKMYGSEGPLGPQTGYAPSFGAIGGVTGLVGHEDRVPEGMNIRFGDTSAGAAAAFATVAALHHRERTGEGQQVDLSAVETMSSLVGDRLLEYALTGDVPRHRGNAHDALAPHGFFPCARNAWISIACEEEPEWQALCELLENIDLARDPRFASLSQRRTHRRELEAELAALTAAHEACNLGARLRAAGVAAYPAASSLDLMASDTFWSNGTYRTVLNGNGDARPVVGPSWRMAPDEADIANGAPTLGQHDNYVYRELLGLEEAEYDRLKANGAIS
ncbi:CaiB/BaiF CoA transferase family protein [Novosphingobium decolorationis]|uniref:CoA transferase n=1 Tax=Novosphingobium decolorationis TaxID=2698673 RepID=A0ABX8E9H8_9SPHN|nr:CoA transferase [Novosphingobium decolorationis]QVM84696.1 CoA transferase [Novosphingobium decolorationis]